MRPHLVRPLSPATETRRARPAVLASAVFAALLFPAACDDEAPTGPVAPTATITRPAAGLVVVEGTPLELAGGATDPQEGPLGGERLAWTSSLDGPLGTGSSLRVGAASVGVHTITLTATDSDGNTDDASVSVLVEELEFLAGTLADPEIGVIVNSGGNAVRLFQLGDPDELRDIALGASSAVTPTGISIRGEVAAVPLGNAASVAVIDLRSQQVTSFFLFESGNATGSAFVDDATVLVANQETDQVGSFAPGQAGGRVTGLVSVTQFPAGIVPSARCGPSSSRPTWATTSRRPATAW